VTAVRLAQVEHVNPAIVGESYDGLRGLLAAAAAHAESGPRSCAHKTKSSDIGDLRFEAAVFRDRVTEITTDVNPSGLILALIGTYSSSISKKKEKRYSIGKMRCRHRK